MPLNAANLPCDCENLFSVEDYFLAANVENLMLYVGGRFHCSVGLDAGEGLVEVVDEVVDVFGAYREPDGALGDALLGQLAGVEL